MIGPAYARAYPDRVLSLGLLSTAAGRTKDDSAKVWAVVRAMEEKGVEQVLDTLIDRWYTDAFVEAMQSGHLSAAALDVFEEEPLPPESPLWDLPNLLISAHSSVSVDRYAEDVFELFVDNLERYVRDEPLRNQMDMAALGME